MFAGEKRIITTPYTSSAGQLVMALAVLITRNGKIAAVLSANIAVDEITSFIGTLTTENQVFVSRADGFILAAKEDGYVGTNLFEQRPSYKKYEGQSGSQHFYLFENNEYFVINAKIASSGWSVWAWDASDNIYAASNLNFIMCFTISIVLILLSLLAIYVLVTKLTYTPIGGEPKGIESLVKRVASGDLTLKMTVTGKETGVYAATIVMINSLKEIIGGTNEAIAQLNSSSSKIKETATKVNSSSERQMTQLENTSTAMHEMTVTVEDVARNALQAPTAAKEANDFSDQGNVSCSRYE